MSAAMENQIDFLNHKAEILLSVLNNEKHTTSEEKEYINDLQWLIKFSKEHASVDTFARKLFLNNSKLDLIKLKNCLSVFFLIEQLRRPVDPRYDTFFATLLETKFVMPKDLKIISWNYDMQFEMAYQLFTNQDDLYNAQANLGVFLKSNDNWRASEKFGIYKLNGSSIAYTSDNAKLTKVYTNSKNKEISIEILHEIFNSYCHFKKDHSKYTLGLSFAWEEEHIVNGKDIVSITKEKTIDTEILVIIGYSIPYFNRKIDRDLIKNMTKLEKVYFQSPEATGLIERFSSIRNDIDPTQLVPIENCAQFYIPNEL
jgi:hypothetical protein